MVYRRHTWPPEKARPERSPMQMPVPPKRSSGKLYPRPPQSVPSTPQRVPSTPPEAHALTLRDPDPSRVTMTPPEAYVVGSSRDPDPSRRPMTPPSKHGVFIQGILTLSSEAPSLEPEPVAPEPVEPEPVEPQPVEAVPKSRWPRGTVGNDLYESSKELKSQGLVSKAAQLAKAGPSPVAASSKSSNSSSSSESRKSKVGI